MSMNPIPAACVGGALLLASVTAPNQQSLPQQQSPPVFRGGVDLVALDVTVVDRDGVPVTGLTAADFTVTLAGQVRPVRALDFVTFGGTPAVEVTSASRETTNNPALAARTSRGGRVIVLLIDDLSAKSGQMKLLTNSAARMLASFDSGDLVGLTTSSGLGPVVNPTRDRSAVIAALASKDVMGRYDDLAAPFYIAINEAIEIDLGIRDVLPRVA